jgi:hypothetical protein
LSSGTNSKPGKYPARSRGQAAVSEEYTDFIIRKEEFVKQVSIKNQAVIRLSEEYTRSFFRDEE